MKTKCIKGNKVIDIYAKYLLSEKENLKIKLALVGIRYNLNHWGFYEYLIENERLPVFNKSNEKIANEIGISVSTVKRVKRDFEIIGIIKIFKQAKKADIIHFKRLIEKDTSEKNHVPDSPKKADKSVKKNSNHGSKKATNINSAKNNTDEKYQTPRNLLTEMIAKKFNLNIKFATG
jgi:hypothetical protein